MFPDEGDLSERLEGSGFEPEGGGATGSEGSEFDMVGNAAGRVGTTGIEQLVGRSSVGMYAPPRKSVNGVLS
ncbi:MAG: hypothetical protein ACKV2Q_30745 [Planctomycetaceae bacterium]